MATAKTRSGHTGSKTASGNMCSGCGNGMVRKNMEYYCPKCGLTEEVSFDGL